MSPVGTAAAWSCRSMHVAKSCAWPVQCRSDVVSAAPLAALVDLVPLYLI